MKQISTTTGVCFFRVAESCELRAFLSAADFSPLSVDLETCFQFGSIYVDGRRQRTDIGLTSGQVVRVHTRPKRYTHPAGLSSRVVENNEEFLVLDKPANLPTHATLDNCIENAKTLLERELGFPLYTTHRLDIPTEGLLILAKTPAAQKQINRLFSEGRVRKVYRSLNTRAVAPGILTHYMDPESHVPKVLSDVETAGWWKCQLRVESNWRIGEYQAHEITLMTGRTHQIRAQMSVMGAPVIGDVKYGGPEAAAENTARERIALECYSLSFALRSRTYPISRQRSAYPLV